MIQTLPLNHTHRDMVLRIIRLRDVVAWTNKKYGQGLILCTVEGSTGEKVRIAKPDGTLTNVRPDNVMVVTHQVIKNIEGNVGRNVDLEATR